MQILTDLVNPLTEAEGLTDLIREKLESDPPIDMTSHAPDKPHTAPMSLMDSPSNMKLKIKYKATPPSHARPSSSSWRSLSILERNRRRPLARARIGIRRQFPGQS